MSAERVAEITGEAWHLRVEMVDMLLRINKEQTRLTNESLRLAYAIEQLDDAFAGQPLPPEGDDV
jgi:hypothetical protein